MTNFSEIAQNYFAIIFSVISWLLSAFLRFFCQHCCSTERCWGMKNNGKKNPSYCFASTPEKRKKFYRMASALDSITSVQKREEKWRVKRASFACEQIILSLKAFRQMSDSWYTPAFSPSTAWRIKDQKIVFMYSFERDFASWGYFSSFIFKSKFIWYEN